MARSGFHSNLFCPARPASAQKTPHQPPALLPPHLTTLPQASPPAAKKDFRSIPNAPPARPRPTITTYHPHHLTHAPPARPRPTITTYYPHHLTPSPLAPP
ncbi:MAG: hypothetical protein LBQ31_09220 [Bacteroidales bacterium]|nr:hypothetical protein [Bacteroidales bacterium]